MFGMWDEICITVLQQDLLEEIREITVQSISLLWFLEEDEE